ncbi:MAG TPA: hypothetical protein VF040_09140 [Ktedonobacterales bacterium]
MGNLPRPSTLPGCYTGRMTGPIHTPVRERATAAGFTNGLDQSWRFVSGLLDRWPPADMQETFPHE